MAGKILIIEDESEVTKALTKQLNTAGFEVAQSMDAMSGTHRAIRERPDLILLDLILPAGGGASVLKNLSRSTKTNKIPVIVIAQQQDEKIQEEKYKTEYTNMNIKAVVNKSCDFDKLLLEIKKAMLPVEVVQ